MHRNISFFLLAAAVAWLPPGVVAQVIPSGCDSIADTPATYAIDYQQDIQPIWTEKCDNCHVAHAGNPVADLDLDPEPSWFNLVDVPSSQVPSQTRVIPRDALRSLLFRKVNCEVPGPRAFDNRMPLVGDPLTLAEQALIYDWIMAGAPIGATDTIFYNGLEARGFAP